MRGCNGRAQIKEKMQELGNRRLLLHATGNNRKSTVKDRSFTMFHQ